MKKDTTFIIVRNLFLITWFLAVVFVVLLSHHRIDNLEKRWEESAQTDSVVDIRCATWLLKYNFFDVSDSLADSVWRGWFDYKATRSLVDSTRIPQKGFWAYWNPRIEASGDSFVVFMADSLWMTGDKPKTTRVSWRGWRRWGFRFYVR